MKPLLTCLWHLNCKGGGGGGGGEGVDLIGHGGCVGGEGRGGAGRGRGGRKEGRVVGGSLPGRGAARVGGGGRWLAREGQEGNRQVGWEVIGQVLEVNTGKGKCLYGGVKL